MVAEIGSLQQKIIDVMSLTGDAADNVPGVSGIGQKTAVKLISAWGSLDALYISVLTGYTDRVLTSRISGLLKSQMEQAFMSRELVRLDKYLPGG